MFVVISHVLLGSSTIDLRHYFDMVCCMYVDLHVSRPTLLDCKPSEKKTDSLGWRIFYHPLSLEKPLTNPPLVHNFIKSSTPNTKNYGIHSGIYSST